MLETASKCSQIPPLPPEWVFQSGWTVYSPNEKPKRVSFPNETILFFDVEVFVSGNLQTYSIYNLLAYLASALYFFTASGGGTGISLNPS